MVGGTIDDVGCWSYIYLYVAPTSSEGRESLYSLCFAYSYDTVQQVQ